MDPGHKLLQHIKTIPNLINEDPSIITPENSSFADLPWSELLKTTTTAAVNTPLSENVSQDDYDKDDPLSYYQEKITKLLNDNQLKDVRKLLLVILNKYKQDPRYQNSPLYLKLWFILIFYLDKHQCRNLILPILFGLIENKIGDKLTLLYETIASELINQELTSQVEATLVLGLKRNAHPIKRLRNTLLYFKQNNSIQFNLKQLLFPNDSILPLHTQSQQHLRGHELLHWLHINFYHFIRKDILKDCLDSSYSLEEYRSLYPPLKSTKHEASILDLDSNVVQLPLTPGFIQSIFSSHDILHHHLYHAHLETSAEPIIKAIQSRKRGAHLFHLHDAPFHVVKKLGEGGFASVYLVQDLSQQQRFYAMKIQQPPHPWEFFILQHLQSVDFILPIYAFQHFQDASFLFMQHLPYGTLLDFFNRYRHNTKSPSLAEPVLLILTWKLLAQLLTLHTSYHVAHNDLKLDNIMIQPSELNNHLDQAMPKLIFIDFGQSIYTPALPQQENTVCQATWINNPDSDYPLFQSSFLPYHADYWQLAVMIHLMLFGIPMTYTHTHTYNIKHTIKRYWHKSLWTRFFHTLLNPTTTQELQNLVTDLHTASLELFQQNSLILQSIYYL